MHQSAGQPKSRGRRADEYLRRIRSAAGPAGRVAGRSTTGIADSGVDGAAASAHQNLPFPIPEKRYRASEIAQHLGLTRQTIHNYATIGLITETARTPGGQKLFDESVFPRLRLIEQMKASHRLQEIRRMLDAASPPDAGPAPSPYPLPPGEREKEEAPAEGHAAPAPQVAPDNPSSNPGSAASDPGASEAPSA